MNQIINRYNLITLFIQEYPAEYQQEMRILFSKNFSDEELAKEANLKVLRKGFFH